MKIVSYKPSLNAGGLPSDNLYPEFDFKLDRNATLAQLLSSLSTRRHHTEKITSYLENDTEKVYFLDANCSLEKITEMELTQDNELVAILIGLDDGDEASIAGQIINRLELIDILKQWNTILDSNPQ